MEVSQEIGSLNRDESREINLPLDTYERMCVALYAYRFGTIGFLDLLTRFEEILNIEPPQASTQDNPYAQE
jgi:hypothetical protein